MTEDNRWWRQKRWGIAVLLLLVTAVGSIDRQAMSVVAKTIKDDFHLSNTQYGALAFAFLFAYGFGQWFAGLFVDRYGTKRALHLAVIWWSAAAMLHALAFGFWSFFIARALLGLTEGANLPAAFKAVSEWFPSAERSAAAGVVTAGTSLGLILAPPLAGTLMYFFDWRAAFVVPGLMGLFWVRFWQRGYFLPEEHPRVSDAERALALRDRIGGPGPGSASWRERVVLWRHYLTYRETWGLILARFVGDGAFYFFAIWLPLYMQQERGFSILKSAFFVAIPFIAADIGSLGGGWLGARLIKNGWSVNRSRKTLIWAGCIGGIVAWPVSIVDSAALALLLAAVAVCSIQVKTASLFPLAADMFPARDVATVWGMSGALGAVGAALFQWAMGALIDASGYATAFAIVSLMCLLQASMISIFIPRIEPLTRKQALKAA